MFMLASQIKKIVFLFFLFLLFSGESLAIYDPLKNANNFFGIHILFPEELETAAKLVNSRNGDWGYVTIPIQAKDKDILKWQGFMDEASKRHLIPIIRLSTEEDFIDKGVWRKPDYYDVIDFANFLNSLSWPTKNRYVILFNEVNRFDEWGGETPDPSYYADLVSFSYKAFKQRSSDFFVILGGFDNAASSDGTKYINEFDYLLQMVQTNNDVFDNIDGFASHSYPNPGFVQAPNAYWRMGTYTYNFEYNFINYYTSSEKLAFITETGWDNSRISDAKIANYYKDAFENIWKKDSDKIVAVTPFLLIGAKDSFGIFSFFKDGTPTLYAEAFETLSKKKGEPELNKTTDKKTAAENTIKAEKFRDGNTEDKNIIIPGYLKEYIKTILGF